MVVKQINTDNLCVVQYILHEPHFLMQKMPHQSEAAGITCKGAANYRHAIFLPIPREIFHLINLL